jgi:hypothetical protein
MVARLRNRKGRIIAWSILSVVCLGGLAVQLIALNWMITDFMPKEGDELLTRAVVGQRMLRNIAFLQTVAYFVALVLATAVLFLIAELTMFTKHDLLVNLWDRVQALEQSQTVSTNSQQPQGPDVRDRPSADG